jgi:hypothetical protein
MASNFAYCMNLPKSAAPLYRKHLLITAEVAEGEH